MRASATQLVSTMVATSSSAASCPASMPRARPCRGEWGAGWGAGFAAGGESLVRARPSPLPPFFPCSHRVVDQDVDRLEVDRNGAHKRLDGGRVADVDGGRVHAEPGVPPVQLPRQRLQTVPAPRTENEVHAFGRQRARGGGADAGRRAGHEGDLGWCGLGGGWGVEAL
jgi:hypothetical protein